MEGLRFAKRADKEQIYTLWKTCFGDEYDYIDLYFTHRFTENNMIVFQRSGRIVSMASFLPADICCGNKEETLSALYVYAVATLPEERKKGYAAGILDYGQDFWGCTLILQPASPKLAKYYEKLGFFHAFAGWHFEGCAHEKAPVRNNVGHEVWSYEFGGISAAEYKTIRDRDLCRKDYVCWNQEAVNYALQENEYCDGYVVKCAFFDGKEYVLLYRIEKDSLIVVETTVPEAFWHSVFSTLCKKHNCRQYSYSNAGGMMRNPVNKSDLFRQGYLNLTLC